VGANIVLFLGGADVKGGDKGEMSGGDGFRGLEVFLFHAEVSFAGGEQFW
jgi:hypothetical protein